MGRYLGLARSTPKPAPAQQRIIRFTLGLVACLTLFAVAAVTVNTATAATADPTGSIGLRLLDAPVSALDDPRARLYIVDHLAPGTVISRRIEVSNTTATTAHVVLYPAAASIVKGSFLGAEGHTPNELSTWTTVAPGEIDVPASGAVTATVMITVPIDAAPGEQYGAVWAEARSTPLEGGVTQVNRVGIRIYLSVGPGGPPAADFTVDSLTAKRSPKGQPIVVASVHNTGGRALDLFGSLQLSAGPGGLSAGPFPADLGTTVGIGDTELVTIVLDKQVPAGPWDAKIVMHSGLLERNAQATITFPDTGESPTVSTTSIPGWLYFAIAAALVAIAVLLFMLYRRRRQADSVLASDDAPELLENQ